MRRKDGRSNARYALIGTLGAALLGLAGVVVTAMLDYLKSPASPEPQAFSVNPLPETKKLKDSGSADEKTTPAPTPVLKSQSISSPIAGPSTALSINQRGGVTAGKIEVRGNATFHMSEPDSGRELRRYLAALKTARLEAAQLRDSMTPMIATLEAVSERGDTERLYEYVRGYALNGVSSLNSIINDPDLSRSAEAILRELLTWRHELERVSQDLKTGVWRRPSLIVNLYKYYRSTLQELIACLDKEIQAQTKPVSSADPN